MSIRIFVPRDAGALAVGADEVAGALQAEASRRKLALTMTRTGSRGLYWLEPMIEVETAQGRIAYGPVAESDVASVLDDIASGSNRHPLCLGLTEEIPFLKRQSRLTFARCGIVDPLSVDDYRAHGGYAGLAKALTLDARRAHRAGGRVRLARARRCGLPDRHQVAHGGAGASAAEIYRLQRRRGRQRHLRRSHDHGRRSLRSDRRHDDCRASRSAPPRATSTSAPNIRMRSRR